MTAAPLDRVDVRGTRFAGLLTTTVAIAALGVTGLPLVATSLTALLAAILLAGAFGGSSWNLWSHTYRVTLRPRLPPARPDHLEPAAAPRFASLVGGVFLVGATVAHAVQVAWLGAALVAIVAVLAALNATTGLCVGCRLYGVLVLRPRTRAAARPPP